MTITRILNILMLFSILYATDVQKEYDKLTRCLDISMNDKSYSIKERNDIYNINYLTKIFFEKLVEPAFHRGIFMSDILTNSSYVTQKLPYLDEEAITKLTEMTVVLWDVDGNDKIDFGEALSAFLNEFSYRLAKMKHELRVPCMASLVPLLDGTKNKLTLDNMLDYTLFHFSYRGLRKRKKSFRNAIKMITGDENVDKSSPLSSYVTDFNGDNKLDTVDIALSYFNFTKDHLGPKLQAEVDEYHRLKQEGKYKESNNQTKKIVKIMKKMMGEEDKGSGKNKTELKWGILDAVYAGVMSTMKKGTGGKRTQTGGPGGLSLPGGVGSLGGTGDRDIEGEKGPDGDTTERDDRGCDDIFSHFKGPCIIIKLPDFIPIPEPVIPCFVDCDGEDCNGKAQ